MKRDWWFTFEDIYLGWLFTVGEIKRSWLYTGNEEGLAVDCSDCTDLSEGRGEGELHL